MSKKRKSTLNKFSKKSTWKKKLRLLQRERQSWAPRRSKYSTYPYLLTISLFRRNIFFNVSNLNGQTKLWTNAGRRGFSGRAKIDHLVVIKLINDFIYEMWRKGIRAVLLHFNHIGRRKYSLKKGITQALQKYHVRFIGMITTVGIAFNGCRRKKIRRK